MMSDILEYQAADAKAKFAELLNEVERGRTVRITRHGKPIARLVPIRRAGPERRGDIVERLKEFRKGQTLDVPVRQLIEEGRR